MTTTPTFAVLALLFACGSLGVPRGDPYLPPPPDSANAAVPEAANSTDAPSAANETDPLNRFGEGDGIHFAAEGEGDTLPHTALEQQVSRTVSRGMTALAVRLEQALSRRDARDADADAEPENVVFSPLSVAAALAIVLLGSGGQTYQEVAQVLGVSAESSGEGGAALHRHFDSLLGALEARAAQADSASEVLAAQAVFPSDTLRLKQRFRQVAQQAYRSDVVPLDFVGHPSEAQQAVNSWVSSRTRGRISAILPMPPPAEARLLIATALYFNGRWQYPFQAELTRQRPFFIEGAEGSENTRTVTIPMMVQGVELPYANTSSSKVVGLPYNGGDVVMWLILPHTPGAAALKEFTASLTADALDALLASAVVDDQVVLLIPRMKLSFSASLKESLEAMGVHSLFDPAAANLSQLAEPPAQASAPSQAFAPSSTRSNDVIFREMRQDGSEPLFVNEVLHKAEVEVTETGTVASAATLVSITRGPHPMFRANRPFLFVIRHEPTKTPLFWGSVVRPTPA